jgi:hypothetical protein
VPVPMPVLVLVGESVCAALAVRMASTVRTVSTYRKRAGARVLLLVP